MLVIWSLFVSCTLGFSKFQVSGPPAVLPHSRKKLPERSLKWWPGVGSSRMGTLARQWFSTGKSVHPTLQHAEQIAFLLDFGAIVCDTQQRSSNPWVTSFLHPNLQMKFQVSKAVGTFPM